MAGLETDVMEEFTARLENSDVVPANIVAQLRLLLKAEKLPKPETLVELYVAQSGDRLA